MRFAAIDVETANADLASICQIGIATYDGLDLIDEWESLIDPRDYFSNTNTSIHGITSKMVEGKPTIPEVADDLRSRLNGQIVVSHTHFDRVAVNRAFESFDLCPPDCRWVDSARAARVTWCEFEKSGYGLKNVCDFLGYEFEHHNALADAKASAFVLLSAIQSSESDFDKWLESVLLAGGRSSSRRSTNWAEKKVTCDGNPDGDLFGEVLVFTGALEISRCDAAELAASVGCCVAASVTKKTTMLVVGDQDLSVLAGHKRSSKQRKAEDLIEKGQPIRILGESNFRELVRFSGES